MHARRIATFALLLCAVSVPPVFAGSEGASSIEESATPVPGHEELATALLEAEQEEEARRDVRERELASPQAAKERQSSRAAYAGLAPAEARQLLLTAFPDVLKELNADPARILSNLTIEKSLGSNGARVANGKGGTALLESPIPVEAEVSAEEDEPVDLTLEASGADYEPQAPLVDIQLPESIEGHIQVGDALAVTSLPGSEDVTGARLGDKDLFFAGTDEDTDTLLAPVAGGVEIFEQLRSAQSPEQFRFGLSLPDGAALRSDGRGGAEVVNASEEVIGMVPTPFAVDAQGSDVPVTLTIDGNALVLDVPHRSLDIAYPVLVDPAIMEDWQGWYVGWNGQGLNYWGWQETADYDNSTGGSNGCSDNCWGWGLYARSKGNKYWYSPNTYGQWVYTAPNSTAFISRAVFQSINGDVHNCPTNYPRGYTGIFDVNTSKYEVPLGLYSPPSVSMHTFDTGWVGGNGTRYAVVGIGAGPSGSSLACVHNFFVGGAMIWEEDLDQPQLHTTATATWMDKTPVRQIVWASDPGVGVRTFTASATTSSGSSQTWTTGPRCTGLAASRCGEVWDLSQGSSQALAFDPAVMPEGIRDLKITAYDATGQPSSTSNTITVRVDHAAPSLAVSGTVTEQAALGTERPGYTIKAVAEDGAPNSQDPSAARVGVKNLKFFEDGSEIEPNRAQPECSGTQSCKAAREYEIPTLSRSVGKHQVLVTSEDALGHLAKKELSYEITRDVKAPDLSLVGMPVTGSVVSAHPGEVEATSSDAGAGVTSLAMLVDDKVVEEATQGCPKGGCGFEAGFGLDLTDVSPGEHVLEVKAVDAEGNSATTKREVMVDPTPPEISLSGLVAARDGKPLGAATGTLSIEAAEKSFEVPGLVAAYTFNEGAGETAHDSAGDHDGTLHGAEWTEEGKFGGALRFDAQEDARLTIPDSDDLDFAEAFTLEAWVRPEEARKWAPVFSKADPSGPDFGYLLYARSWYGPPRAEVAEEEDMESVEGEEALALNEWAHLAVASDGQQMRLYVDGELIDTAPSMPPRATEGPLRVGGNEQWNEYFDGKIDEVRLYDRALSAGEIVYDGRTAVLDGAPVAAYTFNEGAGETAHDSAGDHDATLHGAEWTEEGKFGGALRFDAEEDARLAIPDADDLDFAEAFTLEAWVRPEEARKWAPVFSKAEQEGPDFGYLLYARSWYGPPRAEVAEEEDMESVEGEEALALNEWAHLAVASDGQQMRLYVDGELIDTAPSMPPLATDGPLRIGGNEQWSEYFDGKIDEVRLYDRALSAGEIEEDMGAPVRVGEGKAGGAGVAAIHVELDEEEVDGYPVVCTGKCQGLSASYAYDANLAGLGPHTLYVEAVDTLGNASSETITVDAPPDEVGTPGCSTEAIEEPAKSVMSAKEATEAIEETLPAAVAPTKAGLDEMEEAEISPTYSKPSPNLESEDSMAESETSIEPEGGISLRGVACISPGETTYAATSANVVNSDAAVFANTGAEAGTVIRPTATGVMMIRSINGPEAATSYSWNVKVNEGQEVVELPSGAIAIVEPIEEGGTETAPMPDEPDTLEDPQSLADAEAQRINSEYEIAKATSETDATIIAVIAEPWILLADETIIPAPIAVAPVIEEPNEFIVEVHMPPGAVEAAVYPVQVTASISIAPGTTHCLPGSSPCGQPNLQDASQYAVFWGNERHVADGVPARNPFYKNFGDDNCTNFISQILRAGDAKFMRYRHYGTTYDGTWWYQRSLPWAEGEGVPFQEAYYPPTWTVSDALPRHLWQYGLVHIDKQDPWLWTRGTILAEDWFGTNGKGDFNHLQYVVGTEVIGGVREPLIANSSTRSYARKPWHRVRKIIQEQQGSSGWQRVALAWKNTIANPGEKKHTPANLYNANGLFDG